MKKLDSKIQSLNHNVTIVIENVCAKLDEYEKCDSA